MTNRLIAGARMRTIAFALLMGLIRSASAASPPPIANAERWLALVDAGHYAESWTAAGTIFRQHLAKAAWGGMVLSVRKPLGAVLSRMMLTETKATSLPGVADGEYEVIQFSTAFANKKTAVETVSLTHQPDGWRVDGYFVK